MSILKMRNEEIESSYSSSKIESNWLSEIPMPKLNIGDYSSLSSKISDNSDSKWLNYNFD